MDIPHTAAICLVSLTTAEPKKKKNNCFFDKDYNFFFLFGKICSRLSSTGDEGVKGITKACV